MSSDVEPAALNKKESAEGKDADLDVPGMSSDSDSSSDEEDKDYIPAPPRPRGPLHRIFNPFSRWPSHRSRRDLALWPREGFELFDLRLRLFTSCDVHWVKTSTIN